MTNIELVCFFILFIEVIFNVLDKILPNKEIFIFLYKKIWYSDLPVPDKNQLDVILEQ